MTIPLKINYEPRVIYIKSEEIEIDMGGGLYEITLAPQSMADLGMGDNEDCSVIVGPLPDGWKSVEDKTTGRVYIKRPTEIRFVEQDTD